MKKVKIVLQHLPSNGYYSSSIMELDNVSLLTLTQKIREVTEFKCNIFEFSNANETYFFNEHILRNSVITLIEE
jgi:hypothetical protein